MLALVAVLVAAAFARRTPRPRPAAPPDDGAAVIRATREEQRKARELLKQLDETRRQYPPARAQREE